MKYLVPFNGIFNVDNSELIKEYEKYYCTNCRSYFEVFKPKNLICKKFGSEEIKLINKHKKY